jgi:hypothetical protein
MIKNNLLEKAYHFEQKAPKPSVISAICATITLSFTVFIFILLLFIFNVDNVDIASGRATSIVLISTVFIYLILKFVFTLIFCEDKQNSIKLKILESNSMPVCFCKEALKTWQIILMYMIPFILTHTGLILAGMLTGGSPSFFIILFIMEFFMAMDLTLVIYLVYIKIRYNPDYISVNHHVYDLTLYKKSYIKNKKVFIN